MVEREGGDERAVSSLRRSCSSVASVGTVTDRCMPLSRRAWPGGYRPVSSVACEGSVIGAAAYARSNSVPPAASASMAGVRARV